MSKIKEESIKKIEDNLKDKSLKECFVITPIGKNGSLTFQKTEGLINSVLKPVLLEHGFFPLPAHHIDSTGSINKQIIDKIVNCELVIANLTEINPNVMYELAIRHSFGKKVITVAENDTKLPFDVIDQRTLFYEDSMLGADRLRPALSNAIATILKEPSGIKNISNPIYDAVKQVAAIHGLPTEQQDALSILMNRLDAMDAQLNAINQTIPNTREPNRYPTRNYTTFSVMLPGDFNNDELKKLNKTLQDFGFSINPPVDKRDQTLILIISSNFPAAVSEVRDLFLKIGYRPNRISGLS